MDYTFSTPSLGTPVLADTEYGARLKRGFDFAGGNGSGGATHNFGYILRGTPVGKRLADGQCRPYGVLRNSTVTNGTQRINFPAGSVANRLFFVGDVISIVDTNVAGVWTTTTVVNRTVTVVDPAGLYIEVDGIALVSATEDAHLIVLESLMTNTGASTAVTVFQPPEGVTVGTDFKTFDIPTDLTTGGQLTPRIRNNPVAWGSIIKAHEVPGVYADGAIGEMEYLLNPGAIPSGALFFVELGQVPPNADGAFRFPSLTLDRYAVRV